MPHTSRKKKGSQKVKRVEMTDEEGWTHVTSTAPIRPYKDLPYEGGRNWFDSAGGWKRMVEEAPPHITLQKLLDQYKRCERRFRESACWKQLAKDLQGVLHDDLIIDTCVCFGLGSPSAPSYHLDRRDVSMYQLACFKAIVELLQLHQPNKPPRAFSQEPLFNTIDKEFLAAVSVPVLEDPAGFLHLTSRSFAFAPGHEQYVLKRIIHYDPAMLFGHDLDPYMGRDGRWRVPGFGSSIEVLAESSDEEPKPQDMEGIAAGGTDGPWNRRVRKYKEANPPLDSDIAFKKFQYAGVWKEDGKQMVQVRGRLRFIDGEPVAEDEWDPPSPPSPESDGLGYTNACADSPSESGSIVKPGHSRPRHKTMDSEGEYGPRPTTEEEEAWYEERRVKPEEALVKTKYVPEPAKRSDLHDADLIVSYLADKGSIKMAAFDEHDHAFHGNWLRYRLHKDD